MVGQMLTFNLWMSKMDFHIDSITKSWGSFTSRFAEREQNLGALAARVLALEAGNGSSRTSDSPAVSWPLPSYNGGSTAAGSLDSGPVNDGRNLRREIYANPWSKPPAVPSSCASHAARVAQVLRLGSRARSLFL